MAEPGVLMLNYANPMAMITWAAIDHGKVNTVGLCHGVQNGQRQIARALKVLMCELDIVCSGSNHQIWHIDLHHNGRRIGKDELLAAFERHPVFSEQQKVRIDVLKRFGVYSAESNGHLSECLPWYRKRPEEITLWISLDEWIHGETGGYFRYTTENRNWFETDFSMVLEEAGKPLSDYERTDEHASHILEAIETGRTYRGHFNVKNRGTIANLPPDCIIESPGFVDRFGINMAEGVTLPLACVATCNVSVSVQRMSVEAVVTGDIDLLLQAVLHDPLVGAILNPEEVWQMVVAQERWLPQYAHAVPAARERLKNPKVKTQERSGVARQEVRSVDELRDAKAQKAESKGHGLGTKVMS